MTTFIVMLRFAENRGNAKEQMAGHDAWIQRGFEDGAFLLVGSLQPGLGGVVLARETSRAELEARVALDPFVVHRVVNAEILEVAPTRADPRLALLF